MGAWGSGLYSSDFALDMRGAVKAVARLPFPPDRLLEYLCAAEPSSANDPKDADHTIFWLTVADQFAKRGIDCADARDRALAIITNGADLTAMAALGMDDKSLVKRRAMLKELRGRIAAPIDIAKPRTVLKAPQKLLLGVGEVLVYPVCKGAPTNPYAIGKNWAWVKAWQQDGWGAFVVVERGHAFDFLAWYRPLVIAEPLSDEPTLVELGPAAHVAVAEPGHADGSPPRKHVAEFGWARVDRSVQISGVFSPTWIGGIQRGERYFPLQQHQRASTRRP